MFEIKKAGFEARMEKKAEFEKVATWKTYRDMSEFQGWWMDESGTRSYVVARFGITGTESSVGWTRVRRFVRSFRCVRQSERSKKWFDSVTQHRLTFA